MDPKSGQHMLSENGIAALSYIKIVVLAIYYRISVIDYSVV